jgi:hypothetical protein
LVLIANKIKEQPDITLQELIDEFRPPVCVSALCRTVSDGQQQTQFTDQKKRRAPQNEVERTSKSNVTNGEQAGPARNLES